MEIVTPTTDFDFKSITLADPQPLAGHVGFYFTQLYIGTNGVGTNGVDQEEQKSLCLQLPECVSKQGLVDIKNAKYLDLMFERDKHDELMRWIETLEYTCQDIIDAKKELWFQTDLTRDDIETMMTQVIRLYQSGKFMLMRVFIDVHKGGQKCIAYDENEIGYDLDALEANNKLIPLVMIEGVKFSARSFEISLKLVQVMVLGTSEKKSSCLIKRPITNTNDKTIAEETLEKQPAVLAKPAPLLTFKKQVSIAEQQAPAQAQAQAKQKQQQAPAQAQAQAKQQQHKVQAQAQAQAQAKQQQQAQAQAQAPAQAQAQAQTKQQQQTQAQIKQKHSIEAQAKQPIQSQVKQQTNTSLGNIKPIIKNTTVGNTTVGNTTVGNTTVGNTTVGNNLEKNDIEEITINYDDVSDSINLKNPNEVYYEMYKKAREKAKQCRINAIEAYLEAKQIKTKYMLDDLDDDSDEEDSYEEDSDEDNLDSK